MVRLPAPLPQCAALGLLVERAEEVARGGDYALAHRLARTVLENLASDQEAGAEDVAGVDELYHRVATVYVELLPPAYSDSVDEDIAMLVFEGQMGELVDSIRVSIDDTVLTRMVNCQRMTAYSVPMAYNDRTMRALAFIARARETQMARWLGRARTYLPVIQRLAADSGLPVDLTYLPLIESGFNPRAYSYAHASGIWQFIASTGSRYGLRRSYWLDERRDPIRSTQAALAYLHELHNEFDDWYLALAAYNCGENGVRRAVSTAGVSDYWQLTLPQQTMDYVPKYLAAMMVARNPSCFGMPELDTSAVFPDTVLVSDCIDLGVIARGLRVTLDTLEQLNPHMLRWCTPPNMDNVILYLPAGTADKYRSFAKRLTPSQKVSWERYRVAPGDNLIGIANRFGTSVEAIRSVNKLRSSRIVAGKYLYIPVAATGRFSPPEQKPVAEAGGGGSRGGSLKYQVRPGETLSGVASMFDVSVQDICRWNGLADPHEVRAGAILEIRLGKRATAASSPAAPARPAGPKKTYTVRAGDNLSSIAAAMGVAVGDLAEWNGRTLRNATIRVGETLVYYGGRPEPAGVTSRTETGDTILYQVRSGDNLSRIAELFGSTVEQLARLNGLERTAVIRTGDLLRVTLSAGGERGVERRPEPRGSGEAAGKGKLVYYEVRKGDTLWGISRLFGVSVEQLRAVNGLGPKGAITPGDTLRVVLKEGL